MAHYRHVPGTSPRTKPGLHHTAGHSPVQSHYPGTSPDVSRRPLEALPQEYQDLALRLTINTPHTPSPASGLLHAPLSVEGMVEGLYN